MKNLSNPRCYARSLCDCSDKLSREHYISASVLELLGEMHTISNASWLSPGQSSNPLPVGALGSNVLCERHNNALSDLDACAKEFFGWLLRALSKSQVPAPDQKLRVDGDKLERWVLKACCGALASGNLLEDATRVSREPPRKWLDILFSESAWEVDTGLHIRQASMTPSRLLNRPSS